MADKLFEDSEIITKRFTCECMDPAHTMDVSVELTPKKELVMFTFWESYLSGRLSFLERLKRIFKLLIGRSVWENEFFLRREDIPELVDLLQKVTSKK